MVSIFLSVAYSSVQSHVQAEILLWQLERLLYDFSLNFCFFCFSRTMIRRFPKEKTDLLELKIKTNQ